MEKEEKPIHLNKKQLEQLAKESEQLRLGMQQRKQKTKLGPRYEIINGKIYEIKPGMQRKQVGRIQDIWKHQPMKASGFRPILLHEGERTPMYGPGPSMSNRKYGN